MVNNVEAKNRQSVKTFIRKAKLMGYKEEDEVFQQSLKEILETKGSTEKIKNKVLEQLLKLKDIIEFNNKEVVLTNDELQKLIDEKVKEAMSSIKDKSEKNINEITEEKIKKILSEQTQKIINDMDVNSNNIINVNVTVNNINLQRESILDKTYNAARETTSKVASWGTKFKENIVKQKNKQIGNVLTFFEKIKDKSKELKDGVKNKIANNIEKRAIKQNEKALEKEQEALRKERELIEKQKELAAKQKALAERKRRLAEKIRGISKEDVVIENQQDIVAENQQDIVAENQQDIVAENQQEVVVENQENVVKPTQEVSKQEIINLSREIADSYRIDFDAENMEQKVSAEFDRILQNENLENSSNVQAFIVKKIEGLYKIHNIEFMQAQREAKKQKNRDEAALNNQINASTNNNQVNNEEINNEEINNDEINNNQGNNNEVSNDDVNNNQVDNDEINNNEVGNDEVSNDEVSNKKAEVFNNKGKDIDEIDNDEPEVTINRDKKIEDINRFVLRNNNSAYIYEKVDTGYIVVFTKVFVNNGKRQKAKGIDESEFIEKRQQFLNQEKELNKENLLDKSKDLGIGK